MANPKIHRHYRAEEIHWFLRHYWQFSLQGMVEAYGQRFQDASFGPPQYRWLRHKYGTLREWGSVELANIVDCLLTYADM